MKQWSIRVMLRFGRRGATVPLMMAVVSADGGLCSSCRTRIVFRQWLAGALSGGWYRNVSVVTVGAPLLRCSRVR